MNRLVIKAAKAYKVEIFIAGDLSVATQECQTYCNEVGLCVTVEPVNYVFTNGSEMGVRVGLINYGRFPKAQREIWDRALELANILKGAMAQGSFTIQDHDATVFYSTRDCDQ